MTARGAAGGFVVTSGRFTEDAVSFAGGGKLTLIDGPKLLDVIRQAQASLEGKGPATTPRRVPAMSPSMVSSLSGTTLPENDAFVCPALALTSTL